jgi:hypothetical protein
MGGNQRSLGSNLTPFAYYRTPARIYLREVRLLPNCVYAPSLTQPRSYKLTPMGSFSRIEKTTGDKSSYELYGSGDIALGRLLQNRRFDHAMVAFLECLKQITDFARSQDAGLEFHHQYVLHVYVFLKRVLSDAKDCERQDW